ncbi:hypothetical protein [Pandoraea apista]|uniref:hypothetical protein n=1 Tax=Pandoraea apista TaxID=93218 RepID=UPI0009323D79|nr:hypothetical protein [Pandoraea apista]RRX01210.1 hypothetical protein EGJ56_16555 [Pandoraea apista]RSK80377.1 hypothetical protein EJE96_16905 [Pandoraea apista]
MSNTPPGRPFELAGAITPRADERFDGAVDAYCDGHYIGRCEFSSIDAHDASEAAEQIRKRIELRIEDRVAREASTSH